MSKKIDNFFSRMKQAVYAGKAAGNVSSGLDHRKLVFCEGDLMY